MTNPIEYIDKKKLLEWLDTKANAQHFGAVYATLDEVFKEVKSGTFDDHSAQEEIKHGPSVAELKQYIECRADRDEWKAGAIQAERERDEANRLLQKRRKLSEMWERNADSLAKEVRLLREERNALLERLKKINSLTLDGGISLLPHQALNSIHGITSSTIAKLEGSKPNDTPTT